MTASAYLFASDLLDEGIADVLDRLATAGLDGATMAATYHHARDVFPHNPKRKVAYLEGGVAYFHTDRARYGRIVPHRSVLAGEQDPLAMLVDAASQRGMRASAWLVVLHNSRLAEEFPDCAPQTAFGDPLLNSLCPANPDARTYAVALAADVARYGLEAIKLEAVHYLGFDHGGHHERSFVPLSPNARFLLGLCFCAHCVAAAQQAGVDAERLQRHCRERLEAVFESDSAESHETELDESWLRALPEMERYVAVRQDIVTSLVGQIARAVRGQSADTKVIYLDPCGATLGYASGRPATERTAASVGWRDGIDLEAIGAVVDGLGAIGYFADPTRLERELEAYRGLHPRLEVILRPMYPDSRSADELAEKIAIVQRVGAADLSFYHYGFMRLQSLDWIRAALLQPAPAE